MTTLEKRKVERSNNVLIVNFRHLRKLNGYLLGITNNYSNQGVSFETDRLESHPGDVLELILKHPYSQLSVTVTGQVVWKLDGWYKCMTGVKLIGMDQEANSKIKEFMANTIKASEESSLHVQEEDGSDKVDKAETVVAVTKPDDEIILPHENISSTLNDEADKEKIVIGESKTDAEIILPRENTPCNLNEEADIEETVIGEAEPDTEILPPGENASPHSNDEAEKEKIVIDESKTDAEIILPHETTSFISNNEEIELPAADEDDKNKYGYRAGKISAKILLIGLLLIALAVVAVIILVIRSADIESIRQPILSQNTAVVPPMPVKKGNAGSVPDRKVLSPVINEAMRTDIKKAETAASPIDTASVRNTPLQKAEKPTPSNDTSSVRKASVQKWEIIFDSELDVIRPQFRPVIDRSVKAALREPHAALRIEGYAGSIGPEFYNLDLAMKRALYMKKLLMKKGIADRRINVVVYGKSYPVSSPNDEFDVVADRRVDIVLDSSPAASNFHQQVDVPTK